jgi:hypothetical protein
MVPAIAAATVNPSQRYRQMRGVITGFTFTATSFPSL